MSDDLSAADLAASASGDGDADPTGGTDPDPTDGDGGDDGGGSLVEALFETDPDADPADVQGPPWVGEFIVGTQKLLNGLGVSAGEGSGDPAIANFARGAWILSAGDGFDLGGLVGSGDEGDDDGDDGGDPEVSVHHAG